MLNALIAGCVVLGSCGAGAVAPGPGSPTELAARRTWDVYDAGGPGQYPAWVVHFSADWEEDDAGVACADRGGSLVDDAAERWVCIVD
jgi:hypothetical protein